MWGVQQQILQATLSGVAMLCALKQSWRRVQQNTWGAPDQDDALKERYLVALIVWFKF